MGCAHGCKVLFHKLYTNYKKKNSNFTGDRLRGQEKGEKTKKEWGLGRERGSLPIFP